MVIRRGKIIIANAWNLALAGDWRNLVYRLHIKWKQIDLGYVSLKDLGLTEERSIHHQNSGGPELEVILDTLSISASDEMLDFGCGKAGAMLTMAKYPFARLDGVEISRTLIGIARENLGRMNINHSKIFHSDAAAFTDIDRYTFFYMYHPFPRSVTKTVLENMTRSMERRKRRVTLIFTNSVDHDLIVASGFRVEAEFRHLDNPRPSYVYSAGERIADTSA